MTDPLQGLNDALADRYRFRRDLGAGGMALVYLADDLRHRRPVAIKVLRPELAAAIGADRFLREIEITASMSHPSILPVLDSGEAAGLLYYVMPLVDGESLAARLDREGQLPLDDALRIAAEVADGLAYAHGRGILHRDVKPDNILIRDGHAVIADFGIARVMTASDAQKLTQTGIALGSPRYMSPEQCFGDAQIDGRSDVYSLGCVVYEMLAGQAPFLGPTADSVVRQHLVSPPPSLTAIRPTVSPAMARVVEQALAKAPVDRYPTPTAFTEALVRSRTEVSMPAAVRPWRSRSRPIIVAGIVVAALGVAGIAWATRARLGFAADPKISSLVVLPLTSDSAAQEYFSDGVTGALISSLSSIQGLRVISQTSAMHYKGMNKPLKEIAAELDVDAVVEGKVSQRDTSVLITVSLTSANDSILLNKQFTGTTRNVLVLQTLVAREIAGVVKAAISKAADARFRSTEPNDPETLRLYWVGLYNWNQRTPDALARALDFFTQAVARDSTFARAHAGIADAYGLLGCCGYDVLRPNESMPKARRAAQNALRFDEGLADAHTSLAWVLFNFDWDFPEGERQLRRAIELNPGYSTGHMWLSGLLGVLGRGPEAIVEARAALDVDPISLIVNANLGLQYHNARQYDQAIAQYQKTLEIAPRFPIAILWLAKSYLAQGQLDSGVAVTQRYLDVVGPRPLPIAYAAYAQARRGNQKAALAALARLAADTGYVSSYHPAVINIGLGRKDEAFRWLEKAYAERSDFLIYLAVDPVFDPLREDPRFTAILNRIGLPILSPAR